MAKKIRPVQPTLGPGSKPIPIRAIAEGPSDSAARSSPGFPIVGIGASAGGLAAYEAFFSAMPTEVEPEMAFVLVQHLAPDHKSILTDLVQRYTRLHVEEVSDGIRVERNCAYIIPPNHDMALLGGTLHLFEPSSPRGLRLPIDFFFRSLAQDQGERAICIVLSGTGSDGTLGVRAVKGEGGIVLAQSPETTQYDGMPRSVIATGLVDLVLPPEKRACPAPFLREAQLRRQAETLRPLRHPRARAVLIKDASSFAIGRAMTFHSTKEPRSPGGSSGE